MYIIDYYSISPQKTFDSSFFNENIEELHGNRYFAIEPNYNDLIPRGLLRRMSKSVRMGIGAGMPLIQKENNIDGIIIGTATGGISDSIKFLNQIVEYNEGTLTPTNFVQSTANSIAGHLAMMSKNTGYNNTHTGMGSAFESVLLDAFLLLKENEYSKLLIGSVDENSEHSFNINSFAGDFKTEEISSTELLQSNSNGSVCGEGATMFVVSNKKDNAICELVDVYQSPCLSDSSIKEKVNKFLEKNNTNIQDVDSLVLGFSGDSRSDFWYTDFMKLFPETTVYNYKNLVGEYPTAISFATWLTVNILTGKKIHQEAIYKECNRVPKNILIYNNYLGEQHGLILMKSI